jgi:hypothetical protein
VCGSGEVKSENFIMIKSDIRSGSGNPGNVMVDEDEIKNTRKNLQTVLENHIHIYFLQVVVQMK